MRRHIDLRVFLVAATVVTCYGCIVHFLWIPYQIQLRLAAEERQTKITKSISSLKITTTYYQIDPWPMVISNQSLILLWRHPWGLKTEGIKEGSFIGKCKFTYNREMLPKALAVVFHFSAFDDVLYTKRWPHYRHPDQLFVWYGLETPWYLKYTEKRNLQTFHRGFFNWTMSYRLDSDIFYPYVDSQQLSEIAKGGKKHVDFIMSKKTRAALWIPGNCHDVESDRFKYVEELVKAGLPVDRFGECFNNSDEYVKLLGDSKRLQSYKFYLSFENARSCRDYVSGKFWNDGILSGRVPVVWGPDRKDIASLAPPGSFIHTDDFANPRLLASYLIYLHKNKAAYRRYFSWIEKRQAANEAFLRLYKTTREELLCEKARSNLRHHSIPDINTYFYGTERTQCTHD